MKKWVIYTDGSANNNQELDKTKVFGAYSWAIQPKDPNAEPKDFYATHYEGADTTNNKMELLAVLDFLKKAQKPGEYEINTDSSYVITSMNARAQRMASRIDNTLFLPSGKIALNSDLLIAIFEEMERLEKIGSKFTFVKVKGHSGNKMNEFCDRLAQNHAMLWKMQKGI